MTWLQRLTLGQKFLTAFTLLLLLLGLSLAAILFYLSRVNSYVERHKRITVPAISTAADMRHRLSNVTLRAHTVFDEAAGQRAATLRQLISEETALRKDLEYYRATHAARTHPIMFSMLTRHGRADLADQEDQASRTISERLAALRDQLTLMADAIERGAEARAGLPNVDTLSRQLAEALDTLIEVHTRIDAEMKAEGDSLVFQAKLVILALVLLLGLVIVAAYIAVSRQIARPLRRLADAADRVAHHDLSADFEPWPAKDEVGDLARSLGTMLGNIRERTLALERKTRELESFTYTVAHDLKTPLREIEGFSTLLERKIGDLLDPNARHYVAVIHSSALRLTALIDDLLQYSRLEQQTLPTSQVNLRDMLEHVIAERVTRLEGSRPQVTVDLPYTTVTGDPAGIRQVLINLLDNAIKFSRDSKPSEIVIGGTATQMERILWIRDNGIGIEPDQAHKIFGLFERLHGPEEYEGTGVGLAIVKLIMDKHQGRVWVESVPGKGSTFSLAFPHKEP
jgi:signal transduction histidine kinase